MLRSSHSPHLPTQCLCLFSFQNSCGNCICNSVCHPTCQISLSCFTQRRSLFASHLSIPSTLLCHSHSGNTLCLKIIEKVSFNIAIKASYVYILSSLKCQNGLLWRVHTVNKSSEINFQFQVSKIKFWS